MTVDILEVLTFQVRSTFVPVLDSVITKGTSPPSVVSTTSGSNGQSGHITNFLLGSLANCEIPFSLFGDSGVEPGLFTFGFDLGRTHLGGLLSSAIPRVPKVLAATQIGNGFFITIERRADLMRHFGTEDALLQTLFERQPCFLFFSTSCMPGQPCLEVSSSKCSHFLA